MFVTTQLGGQHFCFPDVCKMPTPAGPIPTPYPNIAMPMTATPSCYTILISGGPAQNMQSKPTLSNGDNAGVAGGLVSNQFMGPCQTMMGSTVLMLKGMPAAKMLGMTGHNGTVPNGVGSTLAPSQTKVMVMR